MERQHIEYKWKVLLCAVDTKYVAQGQVQRWSPVWAVQQLEALACLVGVAVKPVSCDGTLSNASFPFRLLISSLEDSPEFHLVLLMLQSIPLEPLLCLVKSLSTWLSMTC